MRVYNIESSLNSRQIDFHFYDKGKVGNFFSSILVDSCLRLPLPQIVTQGLCPGFISSQSFLMIIYIQLYDGIKIFTLLFFSLA